MIAFSVENIKAIAGSIGFRFFFFFNYVNSNRNLWPARPPGKPQDFLNEKPSEKFRNVEHRRFEMSVRIEFETYEILISCRLGTVANSIKCIENSIVVRLESTAQ